ncbi:hypothetical protein BJX61DRAFT_494509 [Aspergillus egyptiacus]|nr:hypothetical protein BJX61DRAFT_494509 [Aspergillus egyptiacus]
MLLRRSRTLLTVILSGALLFVVFSSFPRSDFSDEEISATANHVPKFSSLNGLRLPSFRPSIHKPPSPHQDSSDGETKWFSNWAWLHPFSSSITLDENRSVLPPLPERPYIYTYYSRNKDNGREEDDADSQLLLAWRRAWYAQGFRPAILGRGEAMANPLYHSVQNLDLGPELEEEFFRWLAWGHMGDGLFADWRCFPMARYDHATLSSLRRGPEPDRIVRFDKLGSALFSGRKASINTALEKAIENIDLSVKKLVDLLPEDSFETQQTSSLALYDSATIADFYPALSEKMTTSPAAGRLALVELVNSHLQTTFQNSFPGGISVLKPFMERSTALVEPALRLAKSLSRCPNSPAPSSCPPNLQKCTPCTQQKPMKISQPATYENNTQSFTIGTLPHPYTLVSLLHGSAEVTTRHIRRDTRRDTWLREVTGKLLPNGLGGGTRAVAFKKAVADESAIGTSLWMTVESLPAEAGQALPSSLLDEFEWQLGFKIPRDSEVNVAEDDSQESLHDPNPSEYGVEREYEIIGEAREMLKKRNNRVDIRSVAEAWNLADTEVWRFVKAYRARSIVERKKWEEDEKDFLGLG